MRLLRKILTKLAVVVAVVLLGGLVVATLVRYSPGFGVDERELDPRLSAQSIELLRQATAHQRNIVFVYFDYLRAAAHGDLGRSRLLDQPVTTLLRQRLPLTMASVAIGLFISWTASLGVALLLAGTRKTWADAGASSLAGLLISIPTGVLTLLLMLAHQPCSAIIALVLFPRLFQYSRNILLKSGAAPHIVAARARGVGPVRLLARHVVWPAVPQLIALAGVSVSAALGAAIPVEVFADSPGVGHLAWEAALGRDLPLLVMITVLVTSVTLLANGASDVLNDDLNDVLGEQHA